MSFPEIPFAFFSWHKYFSVNSLDKSKTLLDLSWPAQMFIPPQVKACVFSFPQICAGDGEQETLHPQPELEIWEQCPMCMFNLHCNSIIHAHANHNRHTNKHKHKIFLPSLFFPAKFIFPFSLPFLRWKTCPHLLAWKLWFCVFFYWQKAVFFRLNCWLPALPQGQIKVWFIPLFPFYHLSKCIVFESICLYWTQ